jgi:hypothetical protein
MTLALSLVQIATSNDTLALLFPWRTTALLVPVATAVLLARLVEALASRSELSASRPLVLAGSALAIVGLAGAGVWLQFSGMAYPTAAEELPLLDYVRTHKQNGDLYLVPVVLPVRPESARSSMSIDFRPTQPVDPSRPSPAFDLQRFRLYTGAPIFVDFKSIPYKDIDVLAWNDRIGWTRAFYPHLRAESLGGLVDDLRQRGITHIVVRSEQAVLCPELENIPLEGGAYKLYRVKSPG